jgi:hypothetical protein
VETWIPPKTLEPPGLPTRAPRPPGFLFVFVFEDCESLDVSTGVWMYVEVLGAIGELRRCGLNESDKGE